MSTILEKSKKFVKSVFDKAPNDSLYYHNWTHTMAVYNAAEKIADNTENISEKSKETLLLAVLFHDIAYHKGSENHEDNGAKVAEEFLTKEAYSEEGIQEIKKLILVTKLTASPQTDLEKIIKDADLSHLGNPNYLETTYNNLYKEVKENRITDLT